MHIHILGICGTFMGGIAAIAKSLGHTVTGSDQNVYPPMSTQLEELGITLTQGYDVAQLEPAPDMVVIGNAMSRGNPCVEYVLDKGLPYTSGPEWLKHNLLRLSKNAVSYSSASITKNGVSPTRAETPKFCTIPPIKKPGVIPAYSSNHASILAVVVLPCVPATANTHEFCSKLCFNHSGPEV